MLRFYPKHYRERFGEGMEQTFSDLGRERVAAGEGLLQFALWAFVDTFFGILREQLSFLTSLIMSKKIVQLAIVTAILLSIPLIAMQFSEDMNWTGSDFVFAGVMIFGTGLAYLLLSIKGGTLAYRAAVGIALAAVFLLVWINAAVGIIGDGPVNLMYLGVIAVGFLGAIIARLKPHGMANVLFAMAGAQMLVPVIALMMNVADFSPGVPQVFMLNAIFTVMFVGSGLLFRQAGEK